jgi:hypothetical protein
MRGGYTCLFLRRAFFVAHPAEISELQLGAVSDDGFIAWINGTEVARFNMPAGDPPFNGTSSPALSEPVPFEYYTIKNPSAFLAPGTNVVAIQAFNSSLGSSSDFVINASLSSLLDETPPAVVNLIPPAGAIVRELIQIEVFFNEAVTGVDAADLLINSTPAANVSAFGPGQFVFSFPEPAPGVVRIAWRADHGIQDVAAAPHDFLGGTWNYLLDPTAPKPGLMISEFMAANNKTLNDEDGNSSDWIELYNGGMATVNLSGWYLTDQTNNLTKWRFPNVALLTNSYLVVFASEKNRTNPSARLHTNFKLEKNGDYLALVDSQTNIVSEFVPNYPEQQTDISYGRDRVNPSVLCYFTTPTPGAPNVIGGPGFAPPVEFSVLSGAFLNPFALELRTASSNAVIHYVVGTNLPTLASPIYASPIPIAATTQIRARAFELGLLPGPVRSEHYLALNANVLNFSSDLPLVVLHNYGGGSVSATAKKFVMMDVFQPKPARSSLTNTPDLSARAQFKLRGSSTQNYPKGSFALETWDEFDDDKDVSPLGMPPQSDWIFYAPNNFEPVLIHNPFIFELSNQIGRYAPRTRLVEVFLNTAGGPISQANYNGVYVLMEKIKVDPNRVAIDRLEPEHNKPPQVTGGYLLKIDRADPGDSGFSAAGQGILYVDPKEVEIELPQRDPQEQYIRNYFNAFYSALNSANYTDPTSGYAAFVEVDSWIDHHLLNVLAFNVDALRLSGFFYKPRGEKINMGPLWDFDRALGSTDGRDSNPRVWRAQTGDRGTDFFNYPWWGRLFTDPNFWQRYIDRWQELRQDQFSLTNLNAIIETLTGQLREAQPRERTRWGVSPRGGSYQAEINLMKSWLSNRANFMDTNFLSAPIFSRRGGPISPGFALALTGPPGATIYYTLDGTDPRLLGGALSPKALDYRQPIVLQANARVVARARNLNHRNLTGANNPPISSPWSGPTAATFVVRTPPLIITEIMYHPHKPPPGNTNDADSFEYIELKNVGDTAIDLAGVRFTQGIEFNFTGSSFTSLGPAEYVLIVKNRAAFTSRYPGAANIAGEFVGNLDNAGERICLVGPLQEPVLDFRYDPAWYPITDGHGFSLVILDEKAPLNTWTNKTSWRVSSQFEGSPGRAEPPVPPIPPIILNEALTHTELPQVDAIELFNPTASPANIGGWFLTDDFGQPKKFRIPPDTWIPAGKFVVFTETNFNSGGPGSFALSALGDEVYLFSGNAATNLTGYFHGFKFGAAETGVSFGRHLTSIGQEHFVPQIYPTLNAANAGPRIGPVLINEIMYNPPSVGTNNNTRDEYIELNNFTHQTVALFDQNAITNTWRLDGGVEFAFPTNLALPPDGYLLVVSFDPRTNSTALAAFRSYYELGANTIILGPYRGRLENLGERIGLYRPDAPIAPPSPDAGLVPYILVDQLHYGPVSPWPPEADGTGQSLQRRVRSRYGDDPANWQAAEPTPGGPNPGGSDSDTDGDGLPDEWELASGLNPNLATSEDGASGDPDGDGLTNWQEYLSGTQPRDAGSYLRVESITASSGSARLRFTAVAGKTYTVLYREDLATGPWLKLRDVPAQPATTEVGITDSEVGTTPTRFYRLVTPQNP